MGSFSSKMPVTLENVNHHSKSMGRIDSNEILESFESTELSNAIIEGKSLSVSDDASEEQPCSSTALFVACVITC